MLFILYMFLKAQWKNEYIENVYILCMLNFLKGVLQVHNPENFKRMNQVC